MRRALLAALGGALALSSAAGARTEQQTKTFAPQDLGLRITLPASYGQTTPDPGWMFEATDTNGVARVRIDSQPAYRGFSRMLVANERSVVKALDPQAAFRTTTMPIGSVKGVKIVETYRFGRPARMHTDTIYGFAHAGDDYVLFFATTAGRAPSRQAAFDAAASSVRFASSRPGTRQSPAARA